MLRDFMETGYERPEMMGDCESGSGCHPNNLTRCTPPRPLAHSSIRPHTHTPIPSAVTIYALRAYTTPSLPPPPSLPPSSSSPSHPPPPPSPFPILPSTQLNP
ncbi:hypothetical protein AB1N83_009107 [Pleurotus pulmonarius]